MFDEENNSKKFRGKYNYQNIKRWSKKVPGEDIFNLKNIFCPINLRDTHWTIAVISVEEKKIRYYDSSNQVRITRRRGKNHPVMAACMPHLEGLLQYLKDEWKKKKVGAFDDSEWELLEDTSPIQDGSNTWDCGVFISMYADFFSRDLQPVLKESDMNLFRKKIALAILKTNVWSS